MVHPNWTQELRGIKTIRELVTMSKEEQRRRGIEVRRIDPPEEVRLPQQPPHQHQRQQQQPTMSCLLTLESPKRTCRARRTQPTSKSPDQAREPEQAQKPEQATSNPVSKNLDFINKCL